MRNPDRYYDKLVLVCINQKKDGACCNTHDSEQLFQALKEAFMRTFLDVRVVSTGCLGKCANGPTVVIMPDNTWLVEVKETDIPAIVEMVKG